MGYTYQELLYLLLMHNGSEVASSETLAPFSCHFLSYFVFIFTYIICYQLLKPREKSLQKGLFAFLLIDAEHCTYLGSSIKKSYHSSHNFGAI